MIESRTEALADAEAVHLLSPDALLAEQLASPLADAGLRLQRLSSADALASLSEPAAGVLLVDTAALPPDQSLSRFLGTLPAYPLVICIARSGDLRLRLDALRAGVHACFVAPVDPDVLAARVVALSGIASSERPRILVVDDQPIAAAFASRILENAGMETRAVGDPLQVLDAIEAFRPDLVLMDLHMPEVDGMELTSLIRDHEVHGWIPVIFLSSEVNVRVQMDALRIGGDDFIAKPVQPGRLIQTVRERIARASHAGPGNRIPGRDPVTGLRTREVLLRRVQKAMADESGAGLLCIACHPAGADGLSSQRTLAAAAQILRAHAEPTDTMARAGENQLVLLRSRAGEDVLRGLAQSLAQALGAAGIGASLAVEPLQPPVDEAATVLSRALRASALVEAGRAEAANHPPLAAVAEGSGPEDLDALVCQALAGDGFELLYQPIVPLRRRPGSRYEVSVGLRMPKGEPVPLSACHAAAQRLGLLPQIDRWVLERALDGLTRWHQQHPGLQFFVPQSVPGVSAAEWTHWFRDQIIARDLVQHRPVLQFELSDLAADHELAARRFNDLLRLGIRICLNGMDTAPESLDRVGELPVSLVRLAPDAADVGPEELTALVSSFHERGTAVIAAGLDHPRAIARVWQCGVDFIQGSFLQLPAADLSFDFSEVELV